MVSRSHHVRASVGFVVTDWWIYVERQRRRGRGRLYDDGRLMDGWMEIAMAREGNYHASAFTL